MALNIDGVVAVEIKNVDSIKISQFIHDNENNSIILVYKELNGENTIASKQITISENDYYQLLSSNLALYGGVKESLYNYIKQKLGISGNIV